MDEVRNVMVLLCSFSERYMGFANSLIYERDTLPVDVKSNLLSKEDE